jgi:hypothetical protein
MMNVYDYNTKSLHLFQTTTKTVTSKPLKIFK